MRLHQSIQPLQHDTECRPTARRRTPYSNATPTIAPKNALGSGIMKELTRSDGTPPGPWSNHWPFWKFVRVALPPNAPVLLGPQVAMVPGKFTEAMIH
jgi:hypothetical protein